VSRNIVMGRTGCLQEWSYINIWGIGSQWLAIAEALANLNDREGNGYDEKGDVKISEHDSVTAATAATATTASAGESSR